ncbi:YecA family protein [Pseudomonas daroniae]|uniref:YecA family protein n=1 Tax=Phytopseudomonas daroniae TaxID=2487519 RepID=A0A4V2KB36_9GAMM|nr:MULTISPECIES: YecA family protein [Pseudomonas]TBU72253.1 YecA family protein [Pseudomonas daroniae]TBU82154.1 YecA family protein [Pseudomonas daroniae]TBU84510.1 YecA family protein [Pseudomonas sp. FRB 228]TBU92455.1 YecA family protein [Pseudomonas daroniae]
MDNKGLAKLDELLLKHGNDNSILSASELDGYFAAIVSGPRQIDPGLWYPVIWAEQNPKWASDKEGERFMKLAVELMSEAAFMLDEEPDDYEAIFLADNNGQGEKLIVSEWCAGYLRGVAVAGWGDDELPEPIAAALATITLHGAESGSERLNAMSDDEYDASVATLEPAAVAIYQYWQQNLQPVLPVRRDELKVGRNDPCTCGSGKKYKQCCMQ